MLCEKIMENTFMSAVTKCGLSGMHINCLDSLKSHITLQLLPINLSIKTWLTLFHIIICRCGKLQICSNKYIWR